MAGRWINERSSSGSTCRRAAPGASRACGDLARGAAQTRSSVRFPTSGLSERGVVAREGERGPVGLPVQGRGLRPERRGRRPRLTLLTCRPLAVLGADGRYRRGLTESSDPRPEPLQRQRSQLAPSRCGCSLHSLERGRVRRLRAPGGWCFPRWCLRPSESQLAGRAPDAFGREDEGLAATNRRALLWR
jgi:hypothetical protein